MDKTMRSHGKVLVEAWGRQTAEMAGLGTALPCVPTYFNPCRQVIL